MGYFHTKTRLKKNGIPETTTIWNLDTNEIGWDLGKILHCEFQNAGITQSYSVK
jgi:hypothetical protein